MISESERERETDRQTDRQTNRERERERERESDMPERLNRTDYSDTLLGTGEAEINRTIPCLKWSHFSRFCEQGNDFGNRFLSTLLEITYCLFYLG